MHIEVNSNNIFIFVNIFYVNSLEKESLIEQVKNIIIKYKSKLNLKGFYKVKVHVCEEVGLFIDIYKIDDIDYSNSLDLRVLILFDDIFYFETEDYFILEGIDNIRFYNNKYYCLVKDVDVSKVIEFGRVIYGDEVIKMLNSSFYIN